MDSSGIVRCRGRLGNPKLNLCSKNPSPKHHFVELLIWDLVLKGRQSVKHVKFYDVAWDVNVMRDCHILLSTPWIYLIQECQPHRNQFCWSFVPFQRLRNSVKVIYLPVYMCFNTCCSSRTDTYIECSFIPFGIQEIYWTARSATQWYPKMTKSFNLSKEVCAIVHSPKIL